MDVLDLVYDGTGETEIENSDPLDLVYEENDLRPTSPSFVFGGPKIIYLGVDVEKKGAMFKHPVMQVGVAYGTCMNDIKTASFCFDYKSVPFEKRCWDEFWCKYEDVYRRICAAAQPAPAQWLAFKKFLLNLENSADRVEPVTDNAAYDVTAIDHHLDKDAQRAGIRYSSKMEYRAVHDSTEQVKGLPTYYRKAIRAKTDKLAPHTHWAEDDAKGILVHFFLTRAVIERLREAERDIEAILA
jgi:hypothetical protein